MDHKQLIEAVIMASRGVCWDKGLTNDQADQIRTRVEAALGNCVSSLNVTRFSAIRAIDFLDANNGRGRRSMALSMLQPSIKGGENDF